MTTQYGSFYDVNSVGPDLNIPIPSMAGQYRGVEQLESSEHPALFGQNQIQHGFGPIYAIPAFPWQPGAVQGSGQMQESSPWQYGQIQNQQHNDFGPVYAIPSFPWQPAGTQWQYGHDQYMESGQWYPWGIHHQPMMPYYPCPSGGYYGY
ncbi:hypothetical protein [Sporosarcina koreensis]|uniref:Morphogenetic protein associated with SpoVID n=1 Tax=Sporosarcina koreensis TaxID=334735 RepID=A0ABW0TY48_9BACL